MESPQALADFHRSYDGHVFRSKAGVCSDEQHFADHFTGAEYQAVVEYAPVQKSPYRAKVKVDARQGTIAEGLSPLSGELIKQILIISLSSSRSAPRL
jgi:regulator of nonsense transcripts 3